MEEKWAILINTLKKMDFIDKEVEENGINKSIDIECCGQTIV